MTLRSWRWQVVAETLFGIFAIPLAITQLEGLELGELPATAWLSLIGVNLLRTPLWTVPLTRGRRDPLRRDDAGHDGS